MIRGDGEKRQNNVPVNFRNPMKKTVIAMALAISGLTLAAAASAQVYVGGSVGEAKWNASCEGTTNCSTHSNAYDLIAGYNLNSNWGVEATYYSLGTISGSVDQATANIRATGVDLSAVFKADLGNKWQLFTKLGMADNRVEITATDGSLNVGMSNRSADPVAGIGATWTVNPSFALRVEFDERRLKIEVPTYSSTGNVARLNVGIVASF